MKAIHELCENEALDMEIIVNNKVCYTRIIKMGRFRKSLSIIELLLCYC